MHLRNAPLVHVLAQVVFSPVLSIANRVAEIQSRLSAVGFPRLVEGTIQQLSLAGEATPTVSTRRRWDFLDKDCTTGFELSESWLVLSTTAYSSAEPFLELLRRGVEILQDTTDVQLVERLGLRYIDLVRLGPDELFEQYVQPGLLAFPFARSPELKATVQTLRTEAVASTAVGSLVVRSMLLPAGQLVPSDLDSSVLVYPTGLRTDRPSLALDFDHYVEHVLDFKSSVILDLMGQLREASRESFKVAVTPFAFERWGPWEEA
jgi:uncharacterized protein (TIGR04255 family)